MFWLLRVILGRGLRRIMIFKWKMSIEMILRGEKRRLMKKVRRRMRKWKKKELKRKSWLKKRSGRKYKNGGK